MCMMSLVLTGGMEKPPIYWNREKLINFERLVEEAKKYDEENGEPDCEIDEKVRWLEELRQRIEVGEN